MIGLIRQELLPRVRSTTQFKKLREALDAFPDVALEEEDYRQAAKLFNTCSRHGIQGSTFDFLVCAVGARRMVSVLNDR